MPTSRIYVISMEMHSLLFCFATSSLVPLACTRGLGSKLDLILDLHFFYEYALYMLNMMSCYHCWQYNTVIPSDHSKCHFCYVMWSHCQLKEVFCVLYGKYVYYEKKGFLFERYPASLPPQPHVNKSLLSGWMSTPPSWMFLHMIKPLLCLQCAKCHQEEQTGRKKDLKKS